MWRKLVVFSVMTAIALGFVVGAFMYYDFPKPQPPGEMISVGTYNLHIRCRDPHNGSEPQATVYFLHGAGGFNVVWSKVEQQLVSQKPNFRICSYDRAGHGWSGSYEAPYDILKDARDLRQLIEKSSGGLPVYIAAHSYGAHVVRIYEHAHPNQLEGVIYIDPASSIFVNRNREFINMFSNPMQENAEYIPWAVLRFFLRVIGSESALKNLFAGEDSQYYYRVMFTQSHQLAIRRVSDAIQHTADEMQAYLPSKSTPTTVISRGIPEPLPNIEQSGKIEKDFHDGIQVEYLNAIKNVRHVIAERSGHNIQFDQPEIIAREVLSMAQSP